MSDNIFDTSDLPFICIMLTVPSICYGPMDALAAMEFCAKENDFFASRNLPGKFVAVPLRKP